MNWFGFLKNAKVDESQSPTSNRNSQTNKQPYYTDESDCLRQWNGFSPPKNRGVRKKDVKLKVELEGEQEVISEALNSLSHLFPQRSPPKWETKTDLVILEVDSKNGSQRNDGYHGSRDKFSSGTDLSYASYKAQAATTEKDESQVLSVRRHTGSPENISGSKARNEERNGASSFANAYKGTRTGPSSLNNVANKHDRRSCSDDPNNTSKMILPPKHYYPRNPTHQKRNEIVPRMNHSSNHSYAQQNDNNDSTIEVHEVSGPGKLSRSKKTLLEPESYQQNFTYHASKLDSYVTNASTQQLQSEPHTKHVSTELPQPEPYPNNNPCHPIPEQISHPESLQINTTLSTMRFEYDRDTSLKTESSSEILRKDSPATAKETLCLPESTQASAFRSKPSETSSTPHVDSKASREERPPRHRAPVTRTMVVSESVPKQMVSSSKTGRQTNAKKLASREDQQPNESFSVSPARQGAYIMKMRSMPSSQHDMNMSNKIHQVNGHNLDEVSLFVREDFLKQTDQFPAPYTHNKPELSLQPPKKNVLVEYQDEIQLDITNKENMSILSG